MRDRFRRHGKVASWREPCAFAPLYSPAMRADLRIHARWIVPVEPADVVHDRCALIVRDGRIAAILPDAVAERDFPAPEVVRLPGHVLIPGLVNSHCHAAMSLFRGLADDLPLERWLNDHIWPAEGRWVSREFVEVGSELAVAEMLRSGTTCFNDMYFFPDVTARVATGAGMRACVGLIVLDFPTAWARDPDEYLAKGLELLTGIKGQALVSATVAPHATYTVSDRPLERARDLADAHDLPVHIHVHETAGEVERAVARSGERPLARLDRLGLVGPRLLAVHMTQLEEREISVLAARGARVVHCPESNLKLASGFCPTARLLAAGVEVALGTDGAASNNDLDLLGEMRTAAILAKGVARDATALPAAAALRMASLDGARVLGLGQVTGSLEPGKAADAAAIRLDRLGTEPVHNPVSSLVYAAGRDQVSDVWVAGRRLLADGALTTVDEGDLLARAREWGERIRQG